MSEALLARVRRVIKARPDLGYSTVTEYIRDAIRRALERDEPAPSVQVEDDDLTVRRPHRTVKPHR